MHQALLIFVALPIVYSVAFFGWCYLAEKKPVFSKRNSRSVLMVLCGHYTVVLILVMLAQTAFRFFPSLPSWFTYEWIVLSRVGERWSYFDDLMHCLCLGYWARPRCTGSLSIPAEIILNRKTFLLEGQPLATANCEL